MSALDRARGLLLVCFFLSGATGLVYEVAWTRSLVLVFGTTTFAVSAILAAFMAGLAAGALVFGRLVDRWGRALRIYGLLELGIAVWAVALPFMLPALEPLYRAMWERYHPSFPLLSLLRFGICFLLLLVPTMLMGGTLPVLVRHFETLEGGLGRQAGLLYGLNTLGAVLGAAAAGFVLLSWLGLDATNKLAASFNIEIGVLALFLSRAEPPGLRPVASPPARPRKAEAWRAGVLAAAALSGFVALLAEIAWTRGLTLVLGSSTYTFTTMLVTFLLGLAAGSLVMTRLLARSPDLVWTLAVLQVGIGVAFLVGAHLFADLPLLYLYAFKVLSGYPALLAAATFTLAALVMLVPALLMGAVFPVVVQLLGGGGAGAGAHVGRAYAANTAGAVLGAFLGGFVLIPEVGIAGSLTVGIALSLAVAVGLLVASGRHWRSASVAAALLVAVPTLAPQWQALAMSSGVHKEAPLYLSLYPDPREVFTRLLPQFRVLYYREGPTATVTVTERPSLEDHRHLALAIDGKVDASTAGDMPTQVLSGHLPLLLHARPEKVLVIGLASGVTVGAVTRHPMREVTAVEIEPAVVEASRLFAAFNHRPLDDARVRLVLDDARNVLLLSRDRHDVIISEPSNPWMSGPAKLFTREFFALGRERLRPGGLFVQWLQLYGMMEPSLKALMRTFQRVFPHVLVFQAAPGDLLLVGSAEPLRVPVAQVRARMAEPAVARDLARAGVRDVLDLLGRLRLGAAEASAWAGEGLLNTDDNALIEFAAPWQLHLETAAENSEALARAGRAITPALTLDGTARERAELLNALAGRALAARDPRRAERVARESLAVMASADAFSVLGEALGEQGREDEALGAWREALALAPRHRATLVRLAAHYHERGALQEAARALAQLARADDAAAQLLLGINHYERGLYRGALSFLHRAARLTAAAAPLEGGPPARLWGAGPGLNALTLYYLHLVYGKLRHQRAADEAWGRFLDALDGWREALERQPAQPERFAVIERLRRRSERGAGRPENVHLAEVLARRVMGPVTRYYKGVTSYLLGYYEPASTELAAVLADLGSAGRRSRARYYLGLAEWKLGRLAEARRHLDEFLEHLADRDRESFVAAEAMRALAAIHAAQGQREQAGELAERAEKILQAVERR